MGWVMSRAAATGIDRVFVGLCWAAGCCCAAAVWGWFAVGDPSSTIAADTGDAGDTRDAGAVEVVAGSERPLWFEDEIAPLLNQHCIDCHNADELEAGLNLSTAAAVVEGGESGPIFAVGNRRHSLLFEVIESGEMPPDGDSLSADEIERVGRWIDQGAAFRDPPETAARPADQHDVLPILLLRCTACHGAEVRRGELDLRTIEGLRQGGSSGAVAIAGDPDASPLIRRVETQACPPHGELLKYFVVRPSGTEIDSLRRWIADGMLESETERSGGEIERGSIDRDHWAFRPLPASVVVPPVATLGSQAESTDRNVDWQPIDAFIHRRLHDRGLDFAPEANRQRLIRRVHVGLVGVPPTVAELRRWATDDDPQWYPRMVDSLLASPQYGERWGRHWLDVAGYADSEGGQSEDPVRAFAWKYRDYVIRAINDDKPWDRFLHEQLAGDELADYRDPARVSDKVVDNLTATGFLRMGVDETGSRTMNFVPERVGLIAEALDVVGSGVMGLTIECARCHSHKYDPISHSDYYRFKAIFQGAFDEHDWMSWKTRRLDLETPTAAESRRAINEPLQQQIDDLRTARRQAIAEFQVKPRVTEAVLVDRHPELADRLRPIDARLDELQARLVPPPTIRALWDRGRPSPTYVMIRGEHDRPGRPVEPGVPAVLSDPESPLEIEPPWPDAESTGRRLAFARWLTRPDHPLTARVLVNRVWALHMGRGIVETLDNFGLQGARPSHPELLDWLARDFVDNGWSLKSLHRRIVLSRTYRQSGEASTKSLEIDPDNRDWSRMTPRRLDGETLRDSLLAVSGRLDWRLGGPPSPVTVREDGLIMERPAADGRYRRSVYVQLRRTELPSLLALFDYPEMRPNCIQRSTSTVSLQSLILKNNASVHSWSGDLATRLIVEVAESAPAVETAGDHEALVRLTFQTLFCRSPTAEEVDEAIDTLETLASLWRAEQPEADDAEVLRLALTTLCHTFVNSAEFSYID